jgi:hypothetical protein
LMIDVAHEVSLFPDWHGMVKLEGMFHRG